MKKIFTLSVLSIFIFLLQNQAYGFFRNECDIQFRWVRNSDGSVSIPEARHFQVLENKGYDPYHQEEENQDYPELGLFLNWKWRTFFGQTTYTVEVRSKTRGFIKETTDKKSLVGALRKLPDCRDL